MKLRILSDLHLEFHYDGGLSFIRDQKDSGYDVLILAGDITSHNNLSFVLSNFRESCEERPIIFVPGNHEYYHTSPKKLNLELKKLSKLDSRLHILDNKSIIVDNKKFVGSTLWYRHSGTIEPHDHLLNDFTIIENFREWISEHSRKSAAYLDKQIKKCDVVITHHLPSYNSVHSFFKDSILNKYFVHDLHPLLETCNAKLWIHGHTHKSMDYVVGTTRVVCNPFGYLRREQNSQFNEKLTIEI